MRSHATESARVERLREASLGGFRGSLDCRIAEIPPTCRALLVCGDQRRSRPLSIWFALVQARRSQVGAIAAWRMHSPRHASPPRSVPYPEIGPSRSSCLAGSPRREGLKPELILRPVLTALNGRLARLRARCAEDFPLPPRQRSLRNDETRMRFGQWDTRPAARNNNARVRGCARQICQLFFCSVANLISADHDSQLSCRS